MPIYEDLRKFSPLHRPFQQNRSMKKTTKKTAKKTAKAPKAAKTVKPTKTAKSTKPAKAVRPVKTSKATQEPKTVKESKTLVVEKKISTAEIEAYRAKLLLIRARLRGDVSTMTDAALNKNRMEASGDLSAMPIHMADVGTDNFEQEQTLSFMQSESGILDMVEEALLRIKEGTYGICESCETRIPKVRLNFLPYASMCVKCAEIAQQEQM